MKRIFPLLILFIANIAFAEIEITNAKARPSMGNLKSGVVYLDIKNKDSQPDILISAQSPVAGICEIHKTINNNNIHQMIKIDKLTIPGNSEVSFAPQNLHIMLIDLKKELALGDKFPVTLSFEKAGDVKFEAIVMKIYEGH